MRGDELLDQPTGRRDTAPNSGLAGSFCTSCQRTRPLPRNEDFPVFRIARIQTCAHSARPTGHAFQRRCHVSAGDTPRSRSHPSSKTGWLELETAQARLNNLEVEHERLRLELHQRAPGIPENCAQPSAGSHSEQIVRRMLEYVHAHYHRPLQLRDVADAVKMNACYVSSLFSQTLGVPFHHYLNELRMAKAKELLRDPTCRAREVACAVGYANSGQFWRVFKVHTGLAPCMWREKQNSARLARR